MEKHKPAKRPQSLPSQTEKVLLCESAFVTVTHNTEGAPQEVFVSIGKAGNCPSAQVDSICKCISIGLRAGVPPENYVKTLAGIRCGKGAFNDSVMVHSCGDAIARALDGFVTEDKKLFMRKD